MVATQDHRGGRHQPAYASLVALATAGRSAASYTTTRDTTFSGGKPADIAIIKLKVSSFALGTPEQKQGFVADATEAVHRATQGRVRRDHVCDNMVHAVGGLWGIEGQAFSNDQLLQSVSQAQAA